MYKSKCSLISENVLLQPFFLHLCVVNHTECSADMWRCYCGAAEWKMNLLRDTNTLRSRQKGREILKYNSEMIHWW